MLFELRNAATERISHCGVLEFIAEEGMIYMPYWVLMEMFNSCSYRSISILQYALLTLYKVPFLEKLLLVLNFEKKKFIYNIVLLKNDFF